MACRLTIMSVHVPTDTPDTCWNKLLFPSSKIEAASDEIEADSVSVEAASNFVESASGGSAFDVIFVELNAGAATLNAGAATLNAVGRTSNAVGRTSNVFSKNAKLFLCVRVGRETVNSFCWDASSANLKVNFYVWNRGAVYEVNWGSPSKKC